MKHFRVTRPKHKRGFTLVELLVVVTIIVVLLALLTPAMDKAIYQAQLAVCGTNLRAVGSGVAIYASDNKRFYPFRRGPQETSSLYLWTWKPNNVFIFDADYDLRPLLRPYFPINKTLSDPLAPAKMEFETPPPTTEIVEVNYNLWFGWQYLDPTNGGPGMRKVGDRFEWRRRSFSTLASDLDEDSAPGGAWFATEHQDHDDSMSPNITTVVWTYCRWAYGSNTPPRGKIDVNHAMADLSVQRLNDLGAYDKREGVFQVPAYSRQSDGPNAGKEYVPQ